MRFRCFDQPLIDAARDAVLSSAREHLAHVAAHPDAPDRAERLDEVVASPQPLLPLLAERIGGPDADAAARRGAHPALLQGPPARGRPHRDGATARRSCCASYVHNDRRVHVVALRVDLIDLPAALAAAARVAVDRPTTDEVVLDVYVDDPDGAADDVELRVARAERPSSTAAGFVRTVVRVASPCATSGRPTPTADQLTFHRIGTRFPEQRVYRGLHPMITRRLHLWRLANFDLERLPSAPDVVLFDCIARDNPADERLIAFAEVRDLTPVRDGSGQVTELPELEQVLAGCLDSLRVRGDRPPRGLEPGLEPGAPLRVAAGGDASRRAARRGRRGWRPSPTASASTRSSSSAACAEDGSDELATSSSASASSRARASPSAWAIRPPNRCGPSTSTPRRSSSRQRRGMVFPYELVPLVAGEAGTFTELDLDDDGSPATRRAPPGPEPGRRRHRHGAHPDSALPGGHGPRRHLR